MREGAGIEDLAWRPAKSVNALSDITGSTDRPRREAEQTGGPSSRCPRGSLAEVAAVFLRLGCTAFGGPAAHIAMMRQEVVERRRWVTDREFLDLFGVANLIPGPSSTEMAIFLGYARAGWPALIVAGALFILPAMAMVLAFAWGYVRFGSLPQAEWVLYGVKPVIIAIIADALWGLAPTAFREWTLAVLGLAALVLYLLGGNVILLLLGSGALLALTRRLGRSGLKDVAAAGPALGLAALGASAPGVVPFSLGTLFLTFLKIGAVTYGSGYILLAFLRSDFVVHLRWLSDRQLIDAVAVGQFTPGPVFTTATFVGYLTGGLWGALLATAGIFLPSFIFVAAIYPYIPRLRHSPAARAFLDGVTAAALGLMAAVTWQLGHAAIHDLPAAALAVLAFGILRYARPNSAWLIAGGALVGVAARLAAR